MPPTSQVKPNGYSAIGRRKTSIALVKLSSGKGTATINAHPLREYLKREELCDTALEPLKETQHLGDMDVTVAVRGGGTRGQAQAIALGIARALTLFDPAIRTVLRHARLLTRDPREVERKKPGLKKARRAPQWQKR
ncbi:MAG: 30S ribosomal protein S9 [Parcubacteria group bacterium]|nr:30S ribosomal protein S9 [Parcubacteria group bacterium]